MALLLALIFARMARPRAAARSLALASVLVLAGSFGGAAAKERPAASLEASALAPSPILDPKRLAPQAETAKASGQAVRLSGPQPKFFTINSVMAKRDGRSLPADSTRVASLDPKENAVVTDTPPEMLSPVRGLEPFGLFAFRAPEGAVSEKWRGIETGMEKERAAIEKCRTALADCSGPALRFLMLAQAAGAHDGRTRLREANRSINASVRYTTDLVQYGVVDYWSSPLETLAAGRGDCEDYAIAKYGLLREAGVSASDMRLLLVRDTWRGEDHAVLAVLDAGEWVVLDNRIDHPVSAKELAHYTPLYALDDRGVHLLAAPYAQAHSPMWDENATPAAEGLDVKLERTRAMPKGFGFLGFDLLSWITGGKSAI